MKLITTLFSLLTVSFAAQADCLSAAEQKQLTEIANRYQEAKKKNPECVNGRGASACQNPLDEARLRLLNSKLDACEAADPVYIKTVEALAKGQCPDLSGFKRKEVALAFQDAAFNDEFFERLSTSVANKSENKILLVKDDVSAHQATCSCLDVTYARLTSPSFRLELMFRPGISPPFACEPRIELQPSTTDDSSD